MKKLISNITHHFDDYECMWNGIEDLYITKTGENIPNQFFFAMSGFCSFVYLKTNKAEVKRMISFGEVRTKQMYSYLSNIVGFEYKFLEAKTPEKSLYSAQKEIDAGFPVVIGAFDMYYLEYLPKLYHKEHIPFHYFLMVGYDNETEKIYLYDCGRENIQELSYDNFKRGINCQFQGLSKANTICKIRMETPNSVRNIMDKCLFDKAENYINPPTSFVGINGIKKLAKEIVLFEKELGKVETKKIIANMVEFMGSVPQVPNILKGINEPDTIIYMAGRDKFSKVLNELSQMFKIEEFNLASELFLRSGVLFKNLFDRFVEYLLTDTMNFKTISTLLLQIGEIEYKAYTYIKNALQ